jgi:hypothetical protein
MSSLARLNYENPLINHTPTPKPEDRNLIAKKKKLFALSDHVEEMHGCRAPSPSSPTRRHTMKHTRILALFSATYLLTGCGTMLHGSRQDIFVQSSVPGASVQSSPTSATVAAPGTLNLERKNNYVLTFTAPGYAPATVNVTNSIGVGTVIADVLLTGLVGVVVDGLTGSWYGLNPETASATLIKQVGAAGPDEIHIKLGHVTSHGQLSVKTDAPGVVVQVTRN